MCLALCHPDPGLKPEGTGDSLWRRTEEDLRGRAQHRIQSHPVQDVSTTDEVAKVELTWTLNKEWSGSLGLEYFFCCGQRCWGPTRTWRNGHGLLFLSYILSFGSSSP